MAAPPHASRRPLPTSGVEPGPAAGTGVSQPNAGDTAVAKTQFAPSEGIGGFGRMNGEDLAPPVGAGVRNGPVEEETPPTEVEEIPGLPGLPPALVGPGTVLEPLPGPRWTSLATADPRVDSGVRPERRGSRTADHTRQSADHSDLAA